MPTQPSTSGKSTSAIAHSSQAWVLIAPPPTGAHSTRPHSTSASAEPKPRRLTLRNGLVACRLCAFAISRAGRPFAGIIAAIAAWLRRAAKAGAARRKLEAFKQRTLVPQALSQASAVPQALSQASAAAQALSPPTAAAVGPDAVPTAPFAADRTATLSQVGAAHAARQWLSA